MDYKVRSKGVGGSEVAALLGLDEYSSPYKVWLNKTGREENNVDNKFTRAGIILEGAVAQFFEETTNYRIIKSSAKQQTVFHPKHDFAFGTPDRRYYANVSGKRVLECKTVSYTVDEVPEKWFCQLQWYLGVLGSDNGAIAWLERGLDFKYKEYEFDKGFFEFLLDTAHKFWHENVLGDLAPEPINVADILHRFPSHNPDFEIEATPEVIVVHSEIKEVKESIKILEERKTVLEDSMKMYMRDAEAIINGAQALATWKASKSSYTKFDSDRFKEENPQLYFKYLREVQGSRRFLIK